ncbi:RNase HII [Rubellimicrobium thermophilum DSM 16684]|uniref:Ribonuclease n=1 Tax=Rubellimicrobium thermophilum DSM 16684 TaxID=1123069 RepID=S9QU01_9RHOB|nr:RNase HII [Rubellimicrobium thermophilum DSM 16684]
MGIMAPDFEREAALWARGLRRVAGVDEAGRGPLAGPVVAAAVILDPARLPEGIDDSKRLPEARRDRLAAAIRESATVGLGLAEAEEIDALGIASATFLAMRRAILALPLGPDHALIDGPWLPPDLPCPATPVVGGDRLSLSVAAASIVAKSWRDKRMVALAQQHPGYGWETNRGYGSKKPHCGAAAARSDPIP